MLRPSDKAWIALGAGVLAWDLVAPPGEMLSDASARYTRAHRVAWSVTVVYVAGHLLHVWGRGDPLTRLAGALGR